MRAAASLTLAGLLGSAQAFWRMECPGRVGMARLDPLINFGDVSNHAHAIHGSSGKSTYPFDLSPELLDVLPP